MPGFTFSGNALLAILAFCMLGGFYAKASFVKGLVFGWIAPLVLVPVWYVSLIAVSLPLRFVHTGWPTLVPKIENPEGWMWCLAALFLHPGLLAMLVTVGLFAFYCYYERIHRDILIGPDFIGGGVPSSPMSRQHTHVAAPPVLRCRRPD